MTSGQKSILKSLTFSSFLGKGKKIRGQVIKTLQTEIKDLKDIIEGKEEIIKTLTLMNKGRIK